MKLLLVRHGNTFDPGEKVVWAGLTNDLRLTEEGRRQAKAVGEVLVQSRVPTGPLYCSILSRTREFAEILRSQAAFLHSPQVDGRLNEIDYGAWTGLTNDEVRQQFGVDVLESWEKRAIWPKQGNWGSSAAEIEREVANFVAEIKARHTKEDFVTAVTSNGRLRYFLKHCQDDFTQRASQGLAKVRTGALCLLKLDKAPRLLLWDVRPDEMGPQQYRVLSE